MRVGGIELARGHVARRLSPDLDGSEIEVVRVHRAADAFLVLVWREAHRVFERSLELPHPNGLAELTVVEHGASSGHLATIGSSPPRMKVVQTTTAAARASPRRAAGRVVSDALLVGASGFR